MGTYKNCNINKNVSLPVPHPLRRWWVRSCPPRESPVWEMVGRGAGERTSASDHLRCGLSAIAPARLGRGQENESRG